MDLNEILNRDEIGKLQLCKLNEILKSVKKISFYSDKHLPEKIGDLNDIAKLEFTTKEDLRTNYPDKLFALDRTQLREIHASSGTTGIPVILPYSEEDIQMWSTAVARVYMGAGVKRGEWVQISLGYGLFSGALGLHYGARKLGVGIIPISAGNTEKQVHMLKDLKPEAIAATPSYLLHIIETMKTMGYSNSELNLRVALCGGEPWTEEMRAKIDLGLNVKSYDNYGLSEIIGPGVSFECQEREGLHINEDFFIPEIVDPHTGKRVSENEEGELVITTLKTAMPLIRYRTRDICSLNYEKCRCRRNFVRMSRVKHRTDDMLVIRGVNIYPNQIESVIYKYAPKTTSEFKIIIDRKAELDSVNLVIEMDLEVIKTRSEIIRDKLISNIKSSIGINVNIDLVPLGSLERSNGKAKRVEDRRFVN